ncbi:methyltransferase [Verrucomicrobiales bacterium]|nr:methyltransferase [Verrucomicrobiales bacterium]MDA7926822.1 methyltransferase [Verrucomicrobiales bacterium]
MTGLDTLPESDPTNILRYRDGIYAVDLLTAAITEFQFFDYLAENPGTLKQLCAHFGWDKRPADVLVTLIKANGFVQEDEHGVLTNTVSATEHLCSESPWNLSEYYASLRDRPVVGDFVRVLKSGKPAHWSGLDEADGDWHGAMLSEEFAKTFTAAMDCRGVFLGKKLADAISELLNDASSLLDVGGGSGVYACALAANTPQLKAQVMEQVPVDGIAREAIEKRGLSDQVSVVVGDMFKDRWPQDCDVHLFSNVMHDWDTDDILKLLERSREALSENGHVVIHETFLNVDKTGPLPVAEYSCILAHSTQGRCYSVAEMSDLLVESGFEFESFQETGGDRGVIVASASELDSETPLNP